MRTFIVFFRCFMVVILSPSQDLSTEEVLSIIKPRIYTQYVNSSYEPAIADTNGTSQIPWEQVTSSDSLASFFSELENTLDVVCKRFYGKEGFSLQMLSFNFQAGMNADIQATISEYQLQDLNRTAIQFENTQKTISAKSERADFILRPEIIERLTGELRISFKALTAFDTLCINDHLADSVFTFNQRIFKILLFQDHQLILQPLNQPAKQGFSHNPFIVLNKAGIPLGTELTFGPPYAPEKEFFEKANFSSIQFPKALWLDPTKDITEEEFDRWYEKQSQYLLTQSKSDPLWEQEDMVWFISANVKLDILYMYELLYEELGSIPVRINLPVKEMK